MNHPKPEIPDFATGNVLVIGDVMLDRYWLGSTSRISPEAPVPVVHVRDSEERPGGAGNVALNIATLGGQTDLIGAVGEDKEATILADTLEAAQVRTHFQIVSGVPTITKLRVLSQRQQLIRLDFEEKLHAVVDNDAFYTQFKQQLAHAKAVILSDYGKGVLDDVRHYIDLARAANLPILIDPKGKDFERYRGATLLTPNRREFEVVVGVCENEAELVANAQAAIKKYDLEALLITRGEEGMTLVRADQPELHFPARARQVYDVTGAGDTVIATCASALAAGSSLENAVSLANIAAGIAVSRWGAATVSVPELRRACEKIQNSDTGVVNETQLLVAVNEARARNEKIVVTNGCFDILHAGHVTYLNQAKALGDRLVVLMNDDASVKHLKGAGRPINTLDRRMAVLAGLEAVDWIAPFSEDTPERVINALKPDVLTKGGDYRVEDIAGSRGVLAHGGIVKILEFVPECSTSRVVEKIKEVEA